MTPAVAALIDLDRRRPSAVAAPEQDERAYPSDPEYTPGPDTFAAPPAAPSPDGEAYNPETDGPLNDDWIHEHYTSAPRDE